MSLRIYNTLSRATEEFSPIEPGHVRMYVCGMTIYDLEEMELSYSPQFGASKDPINMAGFVAAGLLRGDHPQLDFDAVLSASPDEPPMLLDVRTPEEFARGTIPGAINIPIDELRSRIDEPQARPVDDGGALQERLEALEQRPVEVTAGDVAEIARTLEEQRLQFDDRLGEVAADVSDTSELDTIRLRLEELAAAIAASAEATALDERIAALSPYQVDAALMARAKPDAVFLHDLPAHRGEEVTAEVLDGPASLAWDEAENRIHAQKSVLAWCFGAI